MSTSLVLTNYFSNKEDISFILTIHGILILSLAIISIVIITGLTIGLFVGLDKTSAGSSGIGACIIGHETYLINGSSILGKYSRAAIAVDNYECSKIGRQILEKNGRTMDAAIAAAICNGLMNPQSTGIGGGCVITVYSKKRNKAYSIIGREKAPLAANSTMFIGRENMSVYGGLAIAVPGEIRAYKKAYEEFGGGVSWSELFQPTIELCQKGFVVSTTLGSIIATTSSIIINDPALREVFVKNLSRNQLYAAGDIMKRPKLAKTLSIIAEEGPEAFYTGQLSDQIIKEIEDRGGIVTKEDLQEFDVDFREALSVDINNSHTAYTTQAPTSGAILILILNILQGYHMNKDSLKKVRSSSLFYHRLIESFKFAYAKRSELGDPSQINLTELINDLTSKEYANQIRSKINDYKTYALEYYGGAFLDRVRPGTAHLSVVGLDGDAVSLTSTINLYFGSTVIGPLTDIIYNNQMDDFSTPNTINSFGVPSSPSNYIEPKRRPVSSMAPLIIIQKENKQIQQVLGASGGTRITTSIAQVSLINLLFNENIKTAIDLPRLHSQLLPQQVIAEQGFNYNILTLLKQRGHNITCGGFGGSVVQGIEWRDDVKQYWANSDVRKGGAPDGI